jgi:hypothetical protein
MPDDCPERSAERTSKQPSHEAHPQAIGSRVARAGLVLVGTESVTICERGARHEAEQKPRNGAYQKSHTGPLGSVVVADCTRGLERNSKSLPGRIYHDERVGIERGQDAATDFRSTR